MLITDGQPTTTDGRFSPGPSTRAAKETADNVKDLGTYIQPVFISEVEKDAEDFMKYISSGSVFNIDTFDDLNDDLVDELIDNLCKK